MSTTEQDVASRLGWGIRKYVLVLVAALATTLTLALTGPADGVLSPDRSYEASALVVARQLTIRPEQFPRAAEAVFTGGSVAEVVADQLGGDVDPGFVIPDLVRLEPVTDTIALRVIGRSASPARAAVIANLTADAFVMELNRLGPGVGEFAVQDQARPPLRRTARTSVAVPLVVGVVSGLAFGLGLIGLILTLRRPVVDVREAASAAGGGDLLTAIVELPSTRRRAVLPEEVSGLALLVRLLFPGGEGVAALIGCGRDRRGLRAQVLRMTALLGARRRPVILLVTSASGAAALSAATRSETNVRVVEDWFVQRLESAGPPPTMGADGTMVLIGVSADEYDVPQLLPPGARALLFVTEGLPRSHVERAASQFSPGTLDGVVFCRRVRRRARPAASVAATTPAPKRPRSAAKPKADPATRPTPVPASASASEPDGEPVSSKVPSPRAPAVATAAEPGVPAAPTPAPPEPRVAPRPPAPTDTPARPTPVVAPEPVAPRPAPAAPARPLPAAPGPPEPPRGVPEREDILPFDPNPKRRLFDVQKDEESRRPRTP